MGRKRIFHCLFHHRNTVRQHNGCGCELENKVVAVLTGERTSATAFANAVAIIIVQKGETYDGKTHQFPLLLEILCISTY